MAIQYYATIDKKSVARAKIGISATNKNFQPVMRAAVRDAADAAQKTMKELIPVSRGRKNHKGGASRDSVRVYGGGAFKPDFSPGGAGGGGVYKLEVKAGRGVRHFKYLWGGVKPGPRLYHRKVTIIEYGTAPNSFIERFNEVGPDGKMRKVPRYLNRPVNSERTTETVESSVQYHSGFKAQREWFYAGVDSANRLLARRVPRITREIGNTH